MNQQTANKQPSLADLLTWVAEAVAQGEDTRKLWRHAVMQPLNYYKSRIKFGSTPLEASAMFTDEPKPTGSKELDSAVAALVELLAVNDNWEVPSWVNKPNRFLPSSWIVPESKYGGQIALIESPAAFRNRNIYITSGALQSV